jgi:hypothetical protein
MLREGREMRRTLPLPLVAKASWGDVGSITDLINKMFAFQVDQVRSIFIVR